MQAVFEGLGCFIFEFVFEIAGEIAGTIAEEVFHSVLSGDFLTSINRHLPSSVSNEITTLNIQDYKKEIQR